MDVLKGPGRLLRENSDRPLPVGWTLAAPSRLGGPVLRVRLLGRHWDRCGEDAESGVELVFTSQDKGSYGETAGAGTMPRKRRGPCGGWEEGCVRGFVLMGDIDPRPS